MSLKKRLAKVLLLATLEAGALLGVPIRPDQIEEIMRLSQPKGGRVIRNEKGRKEP